MRTTLSALVAPVMIASAAHAAEVTVRIFSEITFHGLSELTSTSTDVTSSERSTTEPPPGAKQGPDGASCQTHDDCRNWCWGGVCGGADGPPVACRELSQCRPGLVCASGFCARPAQPACTGNEQCQPGTVCWSGQCVQSQQPPACNPQCAPGLVCWSGQCVQPQQQPACASNQQCAPGFVCASGQCVPSSPPAPASACTSSEQCAPGLVCVNGACANPPTLRRGTELFLRQRVVQLRQELSFGEGPVIAALASFRHVSPVDLGRTLRQHRRELTALMGDGSDDGWADRFLRRVEELESTCRG